MFSFDVESNGFFGTSFAVGWVDDETGDEGLLVCDFWSVIQESPDDFVVSTVLPSLPPPNCSSLEEMFDRFRAAWEASDGLMLTDHCWPVEAAFLFHAIGMKKPYPLIDLPSVLHARGWDPVASYGRQDDEMPIHNPLCDARQTLRLYKELL